VHKRVGDLHSTVNVSRSRGERGTENRIVGEMELQETLMGGR
jgi:hypothetical protein